MTAADWTDDRVEHLKRLWEAGLSCSQIAAEIGNVTRNAVIGKVHRLGLSGRAKAPSSTPPRQRRVKPVQFAARARPLRTEHLKAATLSPEEVTERVEQEYQGDVEIPPAQAPCTLLELTDDTCKWPIGDPQAEDFHFCGGMALVDSPYCDAHDQIAHQLPPARRTLSSEEHARRVAHGRALAAANRARRAAGE